MILGDALKALQQIGDPRFRRVLLLGVALTLGLLIATYAGFFWLVRWLVPDNFTLPWIGTIGGIDTALGWGSVLVMLALSVFLMVPVASAFTGLFLDDVAQAVEDRHYPYLPPATPLSLAEGLRDAAGFFVVVVAVNLVALVLYFVSGPFAPLLFWAVNGFLLGREYFTLVAARRLGRQGAKALRARHAGQIWVAGTLMAAPLSVPVLNLLVPVLGVAAFTHLFHRVNRG